MWFFSFEIGPNQDWLKSYDDNDTGNEIANFEPNRELGMHLSNDTKLTNELNFFNYSSAMKSWKPQSGTQTHGLTYYAASDVSSTDTNPNEMKRFIALLI